MKRVLKQSVCVLGLVLTAGVWAGAGAGCASGDRDRADSRRGEMTSQAERLMEAEALAAQASRAAEAGNREEAIELYRRSIGRSEKLYGAWNNLGVLLMEDENLLDAAEAFRMASELQPNDARPMENLGHVWLRAGWPEEALKYFNRALARDPNWLPALRGAAVASDLLYLTDEDAVERARRGRMRETDPKWQVFFEEHQRRLNIRKRDGS